LGDRLVVEHVEQADKTAGGVFLPDTAKEKPQEGKVLAVGSGRTLDNGTKLPVEVQVGDRIIYSKYSGSEVKIEGKEVLIISEKDVLAVFVGA
jgi:chaperonin GroES